MKLSGTSRMVLSGIKVLEFSGLAPAPFCGMVLSDFGAQVTRIDKAGSSLDMDRLAHGKRSIAINLKEPQGLSIAKKLSSQADVIIEPFRTGVMEKLGLGPSELMKENPKLIYARLTGFGQEGPLSARAGHDINYLAISGVLSTLGRATEKPMFPINLLADFAGGGLACAFGIVLALFERSRSGKGQVVDANMVEGAAYIASWLWRSRDLTHIWGKPRGENVLDGGAPFYDTYETSDGKYMAVGAIEPQFYDKLLEGLGLSAEDAPQFTDFESTRDKFMQIFASKTQAEWTAIFEDVDACVTPVLTMDEAVTHHHNLARASFTEDGPGPAPRLSRTPGGSTRTARPGIGQHSSEILREAGYKTQEVDAFLERGIVTQNSGSKL